MDKALPLIIPVNDGASNKTKYVLSAELASVLKQIEQRPDGNNKLIVISIAGAFRKGKSFILNIILRYLQHNDDDSDWLGDPDDKFSVDGFPWRNGTDPETEGILLWNRFFGARVNGEAVFILLLDTQGAFDHQRDMDDCARLFALSTLISSVQIFNVPGQLDASNLSYLRLFADFAALCSEKENTNEKPFQTLYFLIRDWQQQYEYPCGKVGGAKYLKKIVEGSSRNQGEGSREMAESIFNAFEKVECFLMPYPGKGVANHPRFDGYLKEVDEDFRVEVRRFVEDLFVGGSIPMKTVNGQPLALADFPTVIQSYLQLLESDSLPQIEAVHRCQAENNHLIVTQAAKRTYHKEMMENCREVDLKTLKFMHQRYRTQVLAYYDGINKIGTEEFSDAYRTRLEEDVDALYNDYHQKMSEAREKNDKRFWEGVWKTAAVGGGITVALGAGAGTVVYVGPAAISAATAVAGSMLVKAGQLVISKVLSK